MGPLKGLKVIEMAGMGPGPFCAMMLSDMGADVLRIDRADAVGASHEREPRFEILNRGRPSVALDLKKPAGVKVVLQLVGKADMLIEGFRPGVMERLGLGPSDCERTNPRLIYGRMTGWGQNGPLAQAAGHDINYIALTGALHAIGRTGQAPTPPLNLVGDFGGGSMYLLFGMLCALWEREQSGRGQVVDAAILDGVNSLTSFLYGALARKGWTDRRGENLLDGGRPWYDTYEAKDGHYVSIGPIEPKFYKELLERLGIGDEKLPAQNDPKGWDSLRGRFAAVFKTKTRDEWSQLLERTDACFAPVLSALEAPSHPQNVARSNFVEIEGVVQPAPAPRFSRTRPEVAGAAVRAGQKTRDGLAGWGFTSEQVDGFIRDGIAVQAAS